MKRKVLLLMSQDTFLSIIEVLLSYKLLINTFLVHIDIFQLEKMPYFDRVRCIMNKDVKCMHMTHHNLKDVYFFSLKYHFVC